MFNQGIIVCLLFTTSIAICMFLYVHQKTSRMEKSIQQVISVIKDVEQMTKSNNNHVQNEIIEEYDDDEDEDEDDEEDDDDEDDNEQENVVDYNKMNVSELKELVVSLHLSDDAKKLKKKDLLELLDVHYKKDFELDTKNIIVNENINSDVDI